MFLSELIEAIYAAGYGWEEAQEARRLVETEIPEVGMEILDQPLSTAQADPVIPRELGTAILEQLSIPLGASL